MATPFANGRSVKAGIMWLEVAASVLPTASCGVFEPRPRYGPDERAWVDKALALYGGPDAASRKEVLSYTTPTVVYLPDLVCVAFKLKPNTLGGEFTACFSRDTGSVAFTHTEGQ
jgi:hypothetical protein